MPRPEVLTEKSREDELVQMLIRMPRLLRRAIRLEAQKRKMNVASLIRDWCERCVSAEAVEQAKAAKPTE